MAKASKYDALSDEFKSAIEGSSTDEIRKRIAEVTIMDLDMRGILEQDDAVQTAKAELKNLMEPYREDFKSFKLQVAFAKEILENKGGGATTASDNLTFKAKVGNALEKAVGKDRLQRDVSV